MTTTKKKYTIQETCTYEIEAESMEAAQEYWLTGGLPNDTDAGDVWEVMKKSFCEVTERSIECTTPDENGVLDGEVEEF